MGGMIKSRNEGNLKKTKRINFRRKRKMKEVTRYYLVRTNASNDIVAVRGDKMYDCPITSSGIDEMSGICVSAMTTEETEKVAEQLQAKYSELAESNQLYNMDDIIEDYADSDRLVDGAEEFLDENENWLLCEVA